MHELKVLASTWCKSAFALFLRVKLEIDSSEVYMLECNDVLSEEDDCLLSPMFCSNPKFVSHSPSIPVPGLPIETAQEAVTIATTRSDSWAQYTWQQKKSFSVCI